MRIFISLLVMVTLPFIISDRAENAIDTAKYCNARFQFCVEYPIDILSDKIISDNGDGIILRSKEEQVSATFLGSWNVENKTPKELYQLYVGKKVNRDSDSELVFKEISEKDFEVSFIDGAFQVYERLYVLDDKFLLFQIKAPEKQKNRIYIVRGKLKITFDD